MIKSWKADFRASLVVFLIAIPLALGITMASGMPPVAGLITGVVGGLVVGYFGGAPLQVSGCAAGLTVMVFDAVEKYGPRIAWVVLIAGMVQMLMSYGRMGRWFRAVSPAVIYGMLAGIGGLIILGQLHVMMDLTPRSGGVANLLALPESLAKLVEPAHHWPMLVALLGLSIQYVWQRFGGRYQQLAPGSLLATVIVALLVAGFSLPTKMVLIPKDALGSLPGLWRLWSDVPAWTMRGVIEFAAALFTDGIVMSGIQLALIASAESLLCAAAVDQMHSGAPTNYNRELGAQGLGNALCGILGALPMTGIIVRSTANVAAGAQSRLATMLHGLWLLLAILVLAPVLAMIPNAVLASILVFTGIKLLDFRVLKTLARYGRAEVVIYLVTLVTILAFDLLSGVALGLLLAALNLARKTTQLSIRTDVESDSSLKLSLHGAASFVGLPRLAEALEKIPADQARVVSIDTQNLTLIDHASSNLLQQWARRARQRGVEVRMELPQVGSA